MPTWGGNQCLRTLASELLGGSGWKSDAHRAKLKAPRSALESTLGQLREKLAVSTCVHAVV